MAANGSDAVNVKRKSEDENGFQENPAAAKNIKLQDSNGGEPSSQSSTGSSDSVDESSTSSSQRTISQACPTDGVEKQNGNTVLTSIQSPEENYWILELTEGRVFEQMILAFLKINPPTSIIYNGLKFNLTEAYKEFWNTLFELPKYTSGNKMKLVNNNLSNDKLLAIVRVLKRGWEDERFFPKRFAPPFLEACLFNREREADIGFTPEMIFDYIEPLESLQKVVQKYYPEYSVSNEDDAKSACIEVLHKIMYRDVKNIRLIWTPKLVGLLEFEQFKFLQKEQPTIPKTEENDLDFTAPHKLWGTFFYGWNEKMINFYFDLLRNSVDSCKFCNSNSVTAKHMTSECVLSMRMRKERHDCIMRKIVKKVNEALPHSPYFSMSKEWKQVVIHQNYFECWPAELSMLNGMGLYPHIVLYSTSPVKRALIIEITISWDCWVKGSLNYPKNITYRPLVKQLESDGFETEFRDIKLGSRGVFSEDLYNLLDEICGMKHREISKCMEKISKKIIEVTFNF